MPSRRCHDEAACQLENSKTRIALPNINMNILKKSRGKTFANNIKNETRYSIKTKHKMKKGLTQTKNFF